MVEPTMRGMLDFLSGGGELGALMRKKDWSSTPIGDPSTWPQSLRTVTSMCINSRFPIVIWWGPELIKLYNDDYRPMLGDKHPKALGAPGREIWPEIWDVIGPMLASVRQDGSATWSEDQLLVLRRAGYEEEAYFTFTYSPIIDESGGVGGVFCAVTETTASVLGARRLRTLAEIAGSGDLSAGRPKQAARAVVAALATNPDDVPCAALYSLEDERAPVAVASTGFTIPPGPAALGCSLSARGEFRFPAWLHVDAGERPQPLQALVLPLRTGGGDPDWSVLLGVSARRAFDDDYRQFFELLAGAVEIELRTAAAVQEHRERAEALAELDRAKTDFFSNISHEFRTPLTLLLAPLEDELARRGDGDRTELELAHRNAMRLLRLVNTLLDFSRAEAGRSSAELRPTDLSTLTAQLAALFAPAVERVGLTFELSCAPLPRPVDLDPDLWERILLNLLSNALKYTFEGRIEVTVGEAGEQAVVRVADTGVGIPARELPRLFERFHRVSGARSRTHEGSGIGLALVHDLVKAHGGGVTVESAAGAGSVFSISLPYSDAAQAVPLHEPSPLASAFVDEALRWGPPRSDGSAVRPSAAGHGQRILVVDDNADMRDYVSGLLAPSYEVTTASDGAEALALLQTTRFDLVLSDVMMPVMDGLALLGAVRADEALAPVPVVLLSARAGEEAAVEGLDRGADDYVVKPFTATELVARVRANLELAHARNAEAERQRAHAATMTELYERDHRAAEVLQRCLLPQALPEEPFLEVVARYEPAEDAALVGGDWYDAQILGDGTLIFTIGDVAGHGLAAAAVMGQVRSAARGLALRGESPATMLSALNGLVWALDPPPMVTCNVVQVSPDRSHLTYAAAGHPAALLWQRGDRTVTRLAGPGGPPLGAARTTAYSEGRTTARAGSVIAFHTDGLVERRGESLGVGLARLEAELLASGPDLEGAANRIVTALRPAGGFHDDLALMLAELRAVDCDRFDVELPATSPSLVTLRRALRRWLSANGLSAGAAYDLLVTANEAASNAVEHAYPPGSGQVAISGRREDGRVELSVRDSGAWRDRRSPNRGRGLDVMESLTDTVDVEASAAGTTVTLYREIDSAP